jgi:predicted RND superfamily exporter protein
MITDAIRNYGERVVGRHLVHVLLALMVVLVGVALAFGTNGLVALGVPRVVAGSVVTLLVVAACIYALYWFATRMIDW